MVLGGSFFVISGGQPGSGSTTPVTGTTYGYGILANLFSQGYFTGAPALLNRARYVIGTQTQYDDGVWTYPWIWAIYLLKTGDLSFVKANFDTEGPAGKTEPSIEDTAHLIAADRTGPGGIMEKTND